MNREFQGVDEVVAPFVDGALTESASETTVTAVNPSNGRPSHSMPRGDEADVDRAVMSARRAFEDGRWSASPPSFRKETLHRMSDLILADAGNLDELDAGDMGKPVRESFGNAAAAAGLMRFYAESVDKVMGDVYVSDRQSFVTQRRVPRGIVGAILPWNFPTYVSVLKMAPALAAGNSVVLKPSELSSRSTMRIARLASQAGLPPGVLNIVPGLGETAGRALGLHKDVDMLTFTGSTEVGKWMLQYAGQSNLKVVVAECGGKSPHILFDDGVELESACERISRMLLTNQGQICSIGSRLLVQRSIEDTAVEIIAERLGNVVMGDALDPRTTFGPVASAKQCSQILRHIESAQSVGGKIACGGKRVLKDTGGYFVEPTVVRHVPPTSRIAQEEIFGPVLTVIPFDDEAEAIRLANGTIYGLAAYVWTANLSRGMRMAKAIRSSVWVNAASPSGEGAKHAASVEPAAQSGIGTEGGLAGLESYLRRQLVAVNHA